MFTTCHLNKKIDWISLIHVCDCIPMMLVFLPYFIDPWSEYEDITIMVWDWILVNLACGASMRQLSSKVISIICSEENQYENQRPKEEEIFSWASENYETWTKKRKLSRWDRNFFNLSITCCMQMTHHSCIHDAHLMLQVTFP